MGNFWEKIKHTAEDVSTLEINTILKSDMVCVKMSDNNLIALYQLTKTYHLKIVELGNKYKELLPASISHCGDMKIEKGHNLFRGKPKFIMAGDKSFRELRNCARLGIRCINKYKTGIDLPIDEMRVDEMILTRIEMQSYEINNLLKKYEIKECHGGDEERMFTTREFMEQKKLELDFRDRQVVQKALDLGVERVVMQTRIGMDGDITTRISERFANNPKQFILDVHNKTTDLSVSFWKTLFNTLVKFGEKILDRF
jgi:hypothetical protein